MSFEILTLSDNLLSIIQYGRWSAGDGNGHGADTYVLNADLQKNKILTNDDLRIDEINLNAYNNTVFEYFKQRELLGEDIGYDPMEFYRTEDAASYIPVVKNHQELSSFNFGVKNNVLQLVEYACPGARVSHGVYIVPIKISYSNN